MTNKLFTGTALLLSALTLAACNSVETKTSLVTPATSSVMSAGPGDVVMSFQSRRALPNAFGKADVFGRTTNAGGTTVRYVGTRGGQAIFERTDVQVTSDATTMSETPLILPSTTHTNIEGTVGKYSVSGTATSRPASSSRHADRRNTPRRHGRSNSASARVRASGSRAGRCAWSGSAAHRSITASSEEGRCAG